MRPILKPGDVACHASQGLPWAADYLVVSAFAAPWVIRQPAARPKIGQPGSRHAHLFAGAMPSIESLGFLEDSLQKLGRLVYTLAPNTA
jgi:hypothetical protein